MQQRVANVDQALLSVVFALHTMATLRDPNVAPDTKVPWTLPKDTWLLSCFGRFWSAASLHLRGASRTLSWPREFLESLVDVVSSLTVTTFDPLISSRIANLLCQVSTAFLIREGTHRHPPILRKSLRTLYLTVAVLCQNSLQWCTFLYTHFLPVLCKVLVKLADQSNPVSRDLEVN